MSNSAAILATLQTSPKSLHQLYQSLPYLGSEFALEHALHDLIREGRVSAVCGIYQLKGE